MPRIQRHRIGTLISGVANQSQVQAAVTEEITNNQSLVFGNGVRRIIASTNPDYPLEDGDLLVLIEAPSYFTDFGSDTAGVAPANWSEPWAAAGATVQTVSGADGGKVLTYASPSNARRLLAWDAVPTADTGNLANFDMVVKWRSSATLMGVGLAVQATGSSGAETMIYGGHIQTTSIETRLSNYTNGAGVVLATGSDAYTANTWRVTRMQRQDGSLRFKEWLHADPEPASWDITFTSSGSSATKPDGKFGIVTFGTGTVEYDWFGVSLGGAAPQGE